MAIEAEAAQQDRAGRLAEQRRGLPDQPGVYLFRDLRGRVIYVGKAKSIRKRVASHFSNPTLYGTRALTDEVDHIEALAVASEAEALLTEQTFIKQYRPRFNIRLRDDKSYPYIAISLDEEFPRVYSPREPHRRERVYFGPYSSAKRVRGTLDLLGKIFLLRSCEGPEPGRHSGSPCLDYYIKRCGAPCVGYVSREEYRRGIDGVMAFLSGRFKQIERDLEQRMYWHAGQQDYEAAALDRNRLQAVRALLERQRVANERAGTYDAVAVDAEGTEANAQVFEVRAAERGGKRRILDLAERNARLALDQEKLKAERRRQQRVEALDGLQRALGLDALPVRIECFDISHVGGTHTVASLVVFEGGAPRQLTAGLEALHGFRERGVAVISLAKRIEEVFLPGVREPLRLAHDMPELQLL